MNLLKAPAAQAESVLSQAEATSGIIAVHVTEQQHFLSNNLVARSAETFATSMLYGGPTCSVIELMIDDGAEGDDALELCAEKGLTQQLPCVMLFSSTLPVQLCNPAELDEALSKLGARSAANKANQADRDFGSSTGGMPSATAVDDIDFTGGSGQTGRPGFIPNRSDAGRTTGGLTGSDRLVDKPGDDMGKDGWKNPKERRDRPPGY